MILNRVYGHALLPHLSMLSLVRLYRTDTLQRNFIDEMMREATLKEYVILRMNNIEQEDALMISLELDILDRF